MAQVHEEQSGLLPAICCGLSLTSDEPVNQSVYLNEKKVVPQEAPRNRWYLDTGASNHMTGDRGAFATLDESVSGVVKFGDGSSVQIQVRGSVLVK